MRDVDLQLTPPGITGLVGPNGAGKSTLIKIWAGLERPSAGTVRVAGFDPWRDRSAAAACIGYVPQIPSLYRSLSVGQHLALATSERAGFDVAGAGAHLDRLGIPVHARAGELSGGQRAQLGLALALGTRAPILLLDEPLAALDPLARRQFLQLLADAVRERNSLAVLSSHVISDIQSACERLIVLGAGSVLVQGAIPDLLSCHWVVQHGAALPAGMRRVASFVADDGGRLELWQAKSVSIPAVPQATQATLEDVVIGYLSGDGDAG